MTTDDKLTAPEVDHQPLNEVIVVCTLPRENLARDRSVHSAVVDRLLHELAISVNTTRRAYRFMDILHFPVKRANVGIGDDQNIKDASNLELAGSHCCPHL